MTNLKMEAKNEIGYIGEKHAIKVLTVEAMVKYRQEHRDTTFNIDSMPRAIVRGASSHLPTQYGLFDVIAYIDLENNAEHLILRMGDVENPAPLVRLHSSCLTGDVLGSFRCDCGEQLQLALKRIAREKNGILVYLAQEGRDIGLANKIHAYALQDKGLDKAKATKLGHYLNCS